MDVVEDYVNHFIVLVTGAVTIGIVGWLLFRAVNRRSTRQSRLHGSLVLWHAITGFFTCGMYVLLNSLSRSSEDLHEDAVLGAAGFGLFFGVVTGNLLGVLIRLLVSEPPDSVQ